jgi:hypothetical protein
MGFRVMSPAARIDFRPGDHAYCQHEHARAMSRNPSNGMFRGNFFPTRRIVKARFLLCARFVRMRECPVTCFELVRFSGAGGSGTAQSA